MIDTLQIIAAAAAETAGSQGPVAEIAHHFGVNGKILAAQVINFGIVATCLWFFAFKPILSTIDQRQKQIADGLQYAEEVKIKLADVERKQAETLKEASLEAQKTVTDARDQAKEHLDQQREDAMKQADELIRKARETIELERVKMINEAREEIARLVVMTTTKVLAKELTSDEKTRFSEAAASEIKLNS